MFFKAMTAGSGDKTVNAYFTGAVNYGATGCTITTAKKASNFCICTYSSNQRCMYYRNGKVYVSQGGTEYDISAQITATFNENSIVITGAYLTTTFYGVYICEE